MPTDPCSASTCGNVRCASELPHVFHNRLDEQQRKEGEQEPCALCGRTFLNEIHRQADRGIVTDPQDRATVTEREDMLEEIFGRLEDLIDSADAEDGCEHEDQVCWNCRQRMFVLALLPVITSCCAKAVREERERRVQAEQELTEAAAPVEKYAYILRRDGGMLTYRCQGCGYSAANIGHIPHPDRCPVAVYRRIRDAQPPASPEPEAIWAGAICSCGLPWSQHGGTRG